MRWRSQTGLADQPSVLEGERGREHEGAAYGGVVKQGMDGEQSAERESSDEDRIGILLERLHPEPGRGQPVAARGREQVSRPRAVSGQEHHPNQKAARRERPGQVAHGERHVGQPVQKDDTPARAGAPRRCAAIRGRELEGCRGGQLPPLPARVHVHLVALEPVARLPEIVVEIAKAAGIERQTLPGRPKPRITGVRAPGQRIGRERLPQNHEPGSGQQNGHAGSRSQALQPPPLPASRHVPGLLSAPVITLTVYHGKILFYSVP